MSTLKKVLLIIVVIIAVVLVVQIINATKYKMIVNVVEGENIMGVNPTAEKLDFGDLSRNNGMTRYVTLENGGRFSAYVVVWQFGDISHLVKLDKNFFSLEPGEGAKLSFDISIPPSASIKKYSGSVWIFRFPKLI